jgi:hypothetical protein
MTTETVQKPEIFVADDNLKSMFEKAFSSIGVVAGSHGWRTIKCWNTLRGRTASPLLAAWTFEDLTEQQADRFFDSQAVKGRPVVFVLFQKTDPAPISVTERISWLNVRNPERVHFVNKAVDEKLFTRRLLGALDDADSYCHIIDCQLDSDRGVIHVVSPRPKNFRRLSIPIEKIPPLRNNSSESLRNFELDEDGIFIYWPELDVHLGWDQLEQAIDQRAYLKAKQQSDKFNLAYGSAIRALREKLGLRQTDIDALTPRHIGRIERGQCRATHAALTKLAKAHKLPLNDYLDELSRLL